MSFPFEFWDGKPLEGPLALDTETTVVDLDKEVPDLVCLTASDGDRTVVVFPRQLSAFLNTHNRNHWTFWNTGFDYWVLYEASPVPTWKVNKGTLGDTMLLEQLLRLAEGRDTKDAQMSLQEACKYYLDVTLEKDEEVRKGFTLEMTKHWDRPEYQKSWEYAARDASILWDLDRVIRKRVTQSLTNLPFTLPSHWGPLTENIQVKASIALAQAFREGHLYLKKKKSRKS
jgi:3'-5' exonuclease